MKLDVLKDRDGHYLLNGVLTLDTVPHAWPELDGLWGSSAQPQSLDFAQVSKVDTAGLAWVIQVLRSARAHNQSLVLNNVPDSLIKLAKISDLEGVLPLK